MPTQDPSQLPESADLLVVGSGIAGLYSTWRILDAKPDTKVVIVERLNRTGGRLQSDLIQIEDASGGGETTVKEEEGGMRFTYEMTELMSLFSALNLCGDIVPFPMTGENNRLCFRGRSFTNAEAAAGGQSIWKELYHLNPAEQDRSPSEILTTAYHQVLAANDASPPKSPTPQFWQEFRLDYRWQGSTLNNWQLSGLLRDMGYSEECITMLSHAIGFEGPYLSRMSAGEAFQLLEDFPASPHYHTFARGFSTLPNKLVEKVEALGAQIFLSTNVDCIERRGDAFDVSLTMSPEGFSSNPWVRDGVSKQIRAERLVLGVARKALETLYVTSPPLREEKPHQLWEDLQTATEQRLLKVNLYFETAWWRNGLSGQPQIEFGPNLTDLPANAVYPFYGIEGMGGMGGTGGDPPAALTIYCDYNNANFWEGLQNVGEKFSSSLQNDHSKAPQTIFPASEAVVEEARRQLCLIFNTNRVPRPIMTSYRLWDGEDDFGFAVHQWAIGADDREVIARLAEPVPGIYTCNEAFSDMQGWVNGTLRSADVMLEKFDIAPLHESCPGCPIPSNESS